MPKPISQIITQLQAFNPDKSRDAADDLQTILGERDELKQTPGFEQTIPAIWSLFERYPQGDFGCPGPLVHFLESLPLPTHKKALAESLSRKPSSTTLWMVNRVMNGTTDDAQLLFWLSVLKTALTRPDTTLELQNEIHRYLSIQEPRLEPEEPAKPTKKSKLTKKPKPAQTTKPYPKPSKK